MLFGWVKASVRWGGEATGGRIALGIAVGVVAKALEVLATTFATAKGPAWPRFGALDDFLPALGPLIQSITQYLMLLSVLLLAIAAVEVLTRGWSRRRYAGGLLILLGLVGQGAGFEGLGEWLVRGLLLGAALLVAYVYLRAEAGLIPLALVSYLTLGLLQQAIDQPYGGALLHYGLAAAGSPDCRLAVLATPEPAGQRERCASGARGGASLIRLSPSRQPVPWRRRHGRFPRDWRQPSGGHDDSDDDSLDRG